MPTSIAAQDSDDLRAAGVTGFDAAWIASQPSRRSAALDQVRSAGPRRVEPLTAVPATTVLPDLISPESRRLQAPPPAVSGMFSWSTGFGTVSAAGDFGSRALVWSGAGGDSRTAALLDPYVSRKVDVGPVSAPRAMTESGGDVVEQFVDWNADNDNGSEVTDYIPAVRDYQVGFTPDENDVVPLTLVEVPPGGYYPGIVERVYWRLQVSYSGTGRLRFWETPDKQRELAPSDDWQFTPHNNPWLQGEGRVPHVHIEGMEMSSDVGDISVSFATATKYFGVAAPVLQTFKTVKVTVAPVLDEFKVISIEAPYFSNRGVKPPIGDGSAQEIEGRIEFRARYVGPNVAERVGFVQFLERFTNDLSNNTVAREFTNGYKDRVTLMSAAEQRRQGLGPNHTTPLLDSDDKNHPWYHKVPQVLINAQANLYEIKMNDHPGCACGVELKEVGWSDYFSTYVAWMHTDQDSGRRTLTPLSRINWEMHFRFSGWANAVTGMTVNSSTKRADPTDTKVGPNDMPRAVPSYAKPPVVAFKPLT